MTLFHRSIDQAIILVTLFLLYFQLNTIDFQTRLFGDTFWLFRPPPLPQKLRKKKKKKIRKNFNPPRPPYWLEIEGSDQKKFPWLTRGDRKSSGGPWNLSVTLSFLPGKGRAVPPTRPAPCTQRSTNQNRPHCTATLPNQLSLHLPHKVAPALFCPSTLTLALSNPPSLPKGQHEFPPQPTT